MDLRRDRPTERDGDANRGSFLTQRTAIHSFSSFDPASLHTSSLGRGMVTCHWQLTCHAIPPPLQPRRFKTPPRDDALVLDLGRRSDGRPPPLERRTATLRSNTTTPFHSPLPPPVCASPCPPNSIAEWTPPRSARARPDRIADKPTSIACASQARGPASPSRSGQGVSTRVRSDPSIGFEPRDSRPRAWLQHQRHRSSR